MEIRTGRHVVFLMHVHLVFVTKYRAKVFSKEILEELKELFEETCDSFDAELTEFDGEGDHVHLLVNYPPKVQVSIHVNSLKAGFSRVIRRKFPEVKEKLWGGSLWSSSYFSGSCGGAPIELVKEYIQNQATPG